MIVTIAPACASSRAVSSPMTPPPTIRKSSIYHLDLAPASSGRSNKFYDWTFDKSKRSTLKSGQTMYHKEVADAAHYWVLAAGAAHRNGLIGHIRRSGCTRISIHSKQQGGRVAP